MKSLLPNSDQKADGIDHDPVRANTSALSALITTARILDEALIQKKRFTVYIKAGESDDGTGFDGSYEIRIVVDKKNPPTTEDQNDLKFNPIS